MKHPWQLYEGWQDGASYYNITQGTSEWEDYVSTLNAFYENSFKVPSFAGFAILSIFGMIVFFAALRNVLFLLANRSSVLSNNWIFSAFRKHISQAPLFKYRHATVYKMGGSFFTIQAPLRGETLILIGLFIANLVPLVAFYTPYTVNNIYWPDNSFVEVGRYLSDRAGILATAQIPPLILLSGRSNPVSFLTGASFATCMLYHRWIARLVTLQTLIHGIGYSIISVREGGVEEYKSLFADVYLRMGVVAAITLAFLCFFSLRWFREKHYEWFVLTHVLLAIITIIGIFYHIQLLNEDGTYADFVNYIYASLFFYLFEKLIRVCRILYLNGLYHHNDRTFCSSTGTVSILSPTKDILSIRLHLRGRGVTKWLQQSESLQPGSSVQIWIPRIQPLSSHPFTVANLRRDEDGKIQLQLYAKVHKGITQRLYKKVLEQGGEGLSSSCQLSMLVEGFYGQKRQYVEGGKQLFVAGGIGITHCMPHLQETMAKGIDSELIWLIRDSCEKDMSDKRELITDIFSPLTAIIATAIDLSQFMSTGEEETTGDKETEASLEAASTSKHTLSIYITQPFSSPSSIEEEKVVIEEENAAVAVVATFKEEKENRKVIESQSGTSSDDLIKAVKIIHSRLQVRLYPLQHRPDLNKVIEQSLSDSNSSRHQTTLQCCGPAEMLDCLRQISRQKNLKFHEEAFSW